MGRDDIIRMAREAGFKADVGRTDKDGKYHPNKNALATSVPVEWVERFAALVAAAERDACAAAAVDSAFDHARLLPGANAAAIAIRARNN